MSHQPHFSWFDYPNIISWRQQILKIHKIKLSPAPWGLNIPLKTSMFMWYIWLEMTSENTAWTKTMKLTYLCVVNGFKFIVIYYAYCHVMLDSRR
jgi:hypothetical protein